MLYLLVTASANRWTVSWCTVYMFTRGFLQDLPCKPWKQWRAIQEPRRAHGSAKCQTVYILHYTSFCWLNWNWNNFPSLRWRQVGWQDPGAHGDRGWLHSNPRAWHRQAIPFGCGGRVLNLRTLCALAELSRVLWRRVTRWRFWAVARNLRSPWSPAFECSTQISQKAQLATRSACCAVVSRRMQCSVVRWFAHQVPRQLTPSSRPTFTLQRRMRAAETTQWCLDTCLSSTSAPAMWPARLRAWPALKEVRCRWPCQEMTSPANASSLPPPPLRRACALPCVRSGWLVVAVIAHILIMFFHTHTHHTSKKLVIESSCKSSLCILCKRVYCRVRFLTENTSARVARPSARVWSRRPCRPWPRSIHPVAAQDLNVGQCWTLESQASTRCRHSKSFKHAIWNVCWEMWSTSAGINTDPPFLVIFFCLAAGQHRHRNDALWRRSVCSVSFCLAWVQDLLVMALEFFKHISSSQLWLWQGSVVKTHVHLTSVTTCYYPSWFSPKSGGRGQAQTARPRPFRPVWGLLPVPSSSSILLKIISLARWARMRV